LSPGRISREVVADRISWVEEMIEGIRSLPLEDKNEFLSDKRNIWAAESCLRRALEALLDLGRHILAKGFGEGVSEYKEIAFKLGERGVLTGEEVELLRILAGYRNRLVHFYHEVTSDELYEICAHQLGDLERIKGAYLRWLKGRIT
jgi:uncharacterized protein YutE (UPF0331/DUF86 family)